MTYTKQTWIDGSAGGTPINAARLNVIEAGIAAADIVVNAKTHGAVGDGAADDTAAIQAAINAAQTTGGVVHIPAGSYRITSTLTVTGTCTVRGDGSAGYIFSNAAITRGTVLLWHGAAGGTVLRVSPPTGAAAPVVGAQIRGLSIDGRTGAAGVGIRIEATAQSSFTDLYVRQCTIAGIDTGSTTDGTYTGLNYTYSCDFERIWTYNLEAAGAGLRLGGLGTGSGTDTAFCTFRHMHIYYNNGNGISVDDADDNAFYMIGMSGNATGTGIGVELKGTNVSGKGARYNYFSMVWPARGGVVARGTTSYTHASHNNYIDGYSVEDAAPQPVVEAGASLGWTLLNGSTVLPSTGSITVGGARVTVDSNALTVGESTLPREMVSSGGMITGSGVLKLTYFTARKTETINSIRITNGGTAAAGQTLCRFGIYSVAANGDLTLVASTANDTTLLAATFTAYTKALSAAWSKAAGQRYAFGLLSVATTAPQTYGMTPVFSEIDRAPRLGGTVASQTDLPTTVAAASVSNGNNAHYLHHAVLLP